MINSHGFLSLLVVLTTTSVWAQETSSENDARFKQFLKRFPASDLNKDGVLTREEVRKFNDERRKNRNGTRARANVPAPTHADFKYGEHKLQAFDIWLVPNATEPTPLVLFIHGGGFRTGQGAIPWYNGTSFAKRGDVVTVSINYRLGALGFANLSHLGAEVASSGVSGILDQIAALEWVRDNIAAFGGDPARVTVAGESAGAMSVGALLGSPRAAGLFRSAIAQSGAAHHFLGAEAGRAIGSLLQEKLAAPDLDALRAVPMEKILEAQVAVEAELAGTSKLGATDISGVGGMPFQPSLDGHVFPEPPLDAVRNGASREVALLVGTNAHESTLWHQGETDERRLEKIVGRYLPDAAKALDAYRRDHPEATPFDLLIALTTDYMFRVPAIRLAEAHAANGGPVWKYLFSWESRAFGGRMKSTHALEIPFTFNNLDRMGVEAFLGEGPLPRELASRMHDAWIAFVNDQEVSWPRYDADARSVMEFGDDPGVREDPHPHSRLVWDGVR